mgnify:CR=1 FL=1
MDKKSPFNKIECLNAINNLKKFYTTDKCNSDKEYKLLKNVIEICSEEKCPVGYYSLHGKCLYG